MFGSFFVTGAPEYQNGDETSPTVPKASHASSAARSEASMANSSQGRVSDVWQCDDEGATMCSDRAEAECLGLDCALAGILGVCPAESFTIPL